MVSRSPKRRHVRGRDAPRAGARVPPASPGGAAPCRAGEADAFGIAAGSCGCDLSAGAVVLFYAYVPVSDPAALAAPRASRAAHGVTARSASALEVDATAHLPARARASAPPRRCSRARRDAAIRAARARGERAGLQAPTGMRRAIGLTTPSASAWWTRSSPSAPPSRARRRPQHRPHQDARLSPEAFHDAILDPSAVVLDVRNWYERSRVGRLRATPSSRPSAGSRSSPSGPPRQENAARFRGRRVRPMYCTGGVRCGKRRGVVSTDPSVAPRAIDVLRGRMQVSRRLRVVFGRDGWRFGGTAGFAFRWRRWRARRG